MTDQPKTNSTRIGRSLADHPMDPEGLVYIHMATGEIVAVPPGKPSAEFGNEHRGLSSAVAEYHTVNRVIYELADYQEHHAETVVGWLKTEEYKKVQKALAVAYEWRSEAHKKYHDLFGGLKMLPDDEKKADEGKDGKKKEEKEEPRLKDAAGRLIELVSLGAITDAKERKEKRDEMQKLTVTKEGDKYTFAKQFMDSGNKKSKMLVDKAMPDKLVYVRHDAIKDWPKMIPVEPEGWKSVLTKDEKSGKTKLDQDKLKQYVKNKAAAVTTRAGFGWSVKHLQKYLSADTSDTLWKNKFWLFKMCDQWNQKMKVDEGAHIQNHGKQVMDVNFKAGAQLMRYSCGMSLTPDMDFSTTSISVRAEGHAELDIAAADASVTLSFPSKKGWTWKYRDQPLMVVLLEVVLGASGTVGASISMELSIHTSAQQEKLDGPLGVAGEGLKAGDDASRESQEANVDVGKQKPQKKQPVGADGSLEAFAGAKAEGTITGNLKWRDPEKKKKPGDDSENAFGVLATVTAGVSGMAGIAADVKFGVEYVDGLIRVTAHAHLCIGLGGGGLLTFAVNKDQIEDFSRCIFYNFLAVQFSTEFRKLEVLRETGVRALKALQGLAANPKQTMKEIYSEGLLIGDLEARWLNYLGQLAASDEREIVTYIRELVSTARQNLRYTLPDVKGQILYALSQRMERLALHPVKLAEEIMAVARAAQAVLKTASKVAGEAKRVMERVTADGEELVGSGEALMGKLFSEAGKAWRAAWQELAFSTDDGMVDGGDSEMGDAQTEVSDVDDDRGTLAGGLPWLPDDSIALSGNFEAWYAGFLDSLAERWPLGFGVVDREDEVMYALAVLNQDDPLFTSEGFHPYYAEMA